MAEAKKQHNHDLTFSNEKGGLDYAKLLETNPDLLASFMHKREDGAGEGSSEESSAHTSMAFAVGNAALRNALGLSQSYAPLQSAAQVQAMAMSAQANLGLEASHGLNMEMGGGGTFGAAYSPDDQPESPEKKS